MATGPRARPAKSALGREVVVDAAVRAVHELGWDAVGMRRVAAALETGPASLYVYVSDRRELMEAVYDRVLGEVELPTEADGDWRERVGLLVRRAVTALGAHGGIGGVALGSVPLGEASLRFGEEVMRLLRAGGVGDQACAWATDLINQYVASAAVEQWVYLREQRASQEATEDMIAQAVHRIDATFRSVSPERYPNTAELAPLLTRGVGDEREAWKLTVILDGLLAQP